ncbi:MAG TPA: hypothetical protein VKU37_10915 [Verrucomicrobiae bacterium]|nr:hypothetical protein [Verrucomicrobiae bacterium]
MARRKKFQEFYGLHLAIAPELTKYIEKRGYSVVGFFHREITLLLLRIASRPETLTYCKRHAGKIKSFGSFYTKHPDAVLDILCFIRKTLAVWRKEQAGFVRVFLRTHSVMSDKKGQLVSIAGMTDKELALYLSNKAGFAITANSVKRERQRVIEIDNGIFGFHEHAEVQQFYRDGKMTPALEQLRSKWKEKNRRQ